MFYIAYFYTDVGLIELNSIQFKYLDQNLNLYLYFLKRNSLLISKLNFKFKSIFYFKKLV